MKKSLAIWQIIISIIVLLYGISGIFYKKDISAIGYRLGADFPIILLAIFALITGISNLKK